MENEAMGRQLHAILASQSWKLFSTFSLANRRGRNIILKRACLYRLEDWLCVSGLEDDLAFALTVSSMADLLARYKLSTVLALLAMNVI
jgi:hypothetical protein